MEYFTVDLSPYYNNIGCSYPNAQGDFTGFGSSYPGEQFPQLDKHVFEVQSFPFILFARERQPNNVEFFSQRIAVPQRVYNAMNVLGASDNGSFYEYITFYRLGEATAKYRLGLSDWIADSPRFEEKEGLRCTGLCRSDKMINTLNPVIWMQVIRFQSPLVFDEILLPDNMCMHMFSLTLEGGEELV
ncbi:hypothetical protein JDW19_21495 [Paenibacillus polymyxa]|uniref:Uncharacterized protein n=1 Tax=Paenibacillus polymyxa TaxID=1406 RepID=A0A8I1J4N3_PAEPO|nr:MULTISPECIES: hypothetical protein [Paenibacillus]KAF6569863.1 hypothetical protein G9G53_21520 [Paenibacillus sp. EKM206P]KAF6585416.1 hypothetical protein G9G52_22730 [Paenibacillus sp. EKM205P]MBM0635685.1 hypothetical protein [Paenibacillus polymyxa]